MTKWTWMAAMSVFLTVASALEAAAQAPPAPVLVAPANGAALVQPIGLEWDAVVDPDGPIGSYTWQVSSTSTFGVVIASGFTNESGDPSIPTRTDDKVSGLPNGTYFWRVKATQIVGGATFSIDSPWSEVRSFTVVGLGPAPGRPSFTSPASPAQFHVREFFMINWTAVPDAHHYVLEADDEPSFSYPLTLTTDPLQFGTSFRAGWGNALSVFYRVVAVSADGVRGLPSPTLSVQITNAAPVPPAPSLLSPIGGASVTLPFTLDWTDTADPQVAGYDVDIDDEPNFLGTVGVLFVQGVTRSDYMVVPDPLLEGSNIFPPGTYFWRVRAVHGDVLGPWSAGQSFTVLPLPATPPGLAIFHIITEPGSVSGGNSTQARVTLNMPAPAGGALVNIASDMPYAQVPATVVVPAGKTDATVSPITTIPVPGATIGDVIAAYGLGWQQNSLGLFPILWGVALGDEAVIGGNSTVGRVTLLNPAPPGGVEVSLVNNDSDFVSLPATVVIPAGETGATFNVLTAPVAVPTQVTMDSGTAFEGYHAPSTGLTLLPAGSPPPPPSLSSLTLASDTIPRRRHHDGDRDAHVARAGRRRVRPPERQHGGAGRHARGRDRARRQPERQLHDHGAAGECAAVRPHPGHVRHQRRESGHAPRDRSGTTGGADAPRVRRQPDGSDRRHLDAWDGLAGDAGAARRRCGDADEHQPGSRPGAAHGVHRRREQREQLHHHLESRLARDDRGGRRDGGRRHEVRLHQRGARPERAAAPVVGDARLAHGRRRQQRVRHRAPERPGAGGRSVRDALDQQPGRQAPAGRERARGRHLRRLHGDHVDRDGEHGGHHHCHPRQREQVGRA